MSATPTPRPRPLWPGSLLGRVALILFCGLAAAHLLSLGLLLYDRAQAVSTMMIAYLARDVASAVAILERVPPAEREQWLPRLERANYRYQLAAVPPDWRPADPGSTAAEVADRIATQIADGHAVQAMRPPAVRDPLRFAVALKLADGTAMTIAMVPPGPMLSGWVVAALAFQLAVLALFSWLAVRITTRPLARLARAADALGADLHGPALPETGPAEVAQAAIAFNAMQRRIAEHIVERERILAAISHDLQTPITRMRLRAEMLEDASLKQKFGHDLAAMQSLIAEGIDLARSAEHGTEAAIATDLRALLESVVFDYADSGQAIDLTGDVGAPIATSPRLVRRIVTNLVDNALKFGNEVEIVMDTPGPDHVAITVRDRGPGIPEDQIDAVLQPFYRLEQSRNRDTGGTGLGLAIAQRLTGALGGELTLANRPGGGLAATLTLPATK